MSATAPTRSILHAAIGGLFIFTVSSGIGVGSSSAHADGLFQCISEGCSADDCALAASVQMTCASWQCYNRCFSATAYRANCAEHLGEEHSACLEAAGRCLAMCQ